MDQYLQFIGNHPYLVTALAAAVVWMIVAEVRRFTVEAKALSPKEAVQLMNNKDAILVDIREEKEYKKGHIIGARNIPLAAMDAEARTLGQFGDRPVIAYCDMGNKAAAACSVLKKQGIGSLYYLSRGLSGWVGENLPLEKS